MRAHRWGVMVSLAAIGALVIAGCGKDTSVSPSATPTAAPTVAPTVGPRLLQGRVTDGGGAPLSGVMLTAFDADRHESTSVWSGADGRYVFPELRPAVYSLRARRIGFADGTGDGIDLTSTGTSADFSLQPTADVNGQLPANYFLSLLHWPSQRVRGDFERTCANCHQIGTFEFQEPRTLDDWQTVVNRMIGYGTVPFFPDTRDLLVPTLTSTLGDPSKYPSFPAPPPPTGDAVRAVVREWEIDPVDHPDCHDLEIGTDGTVYTVPGVYTVDPATGQRSHYLVQGGGHSIERAADGNMWITAPGPEQLIELDVHTKQFTKYDLPRIGDDLGSYPHTLRFDAQGRIWFTLSRSNHVARFDPPTAQFTYYRLPPADPTDSGVPIPVPYGCDVAPDQTVWWSQLYGDKIGRIDPNTGVVTAWRPPFDGPRRLGVGPDNIVWVPSYGSSELGRFDPKTETWKVYQLPTVPQGTELPYNVTVNRTTGDVWITGSNSDTLIRFQPATEKFTSFHLPTPIDFTREIEFGDDGSIWTCSSDAKKSEDDPGSARLIELQLLDRQGSCGDGVLQLGEECDDGNTVSCDGCSADCRVETGCGDGARCGSEECDDGNTLSCDGCSSTCTVEAGTACGDGTVNAACGEQCDPPGPNCTDQCQRVPVCGDGFRDGTEECDDGNTASCDGCSADCRIETGCGDGVVCGSEECDDGNNLDCDGCSSACTVEVGAACGDGIVNTACGEECDPPGAECSVTCKLQSVPLGTRHFTFGGSFYSSPLGNQVPLGTLDGAIDLVAGAPDADGVADVTVDGPVYYSAAILGGTFGRLCVRIDSCQGFVDCDGGTPVGVQVVQDSHGAGINGGPVVTTTGLGDAPPGAVELQCQQTFVQLDPGVMTPCENADYPPPALVVYTTGMTEASFENGNPKIGTGMISSSGESFQCSAWTTEDGPGVLAGAYLVEENPQAGDVANVNRLDD